MQLARSRPAWMCRRRIMRLSADDPPDPQGTSRAPGLAEALSTWAAAAPEAPGARAVHPNGCKHIKLGSGRVYQFTAIDEATRYRILKIYDHNSIQSAIAFVEALCQALPVAIQRIQTDLGSEFGTDFTWHLRLLQNLDLSRQPRYTSRAHLWAILAGSSSTFFPIVCQAITAHRQAPNTTWISFMTI